MKLFGFLALACLLSLMGTASAAADDTKIKADQILFNELVEAPARFEFETSDMTITDNVDRYFKIKDGKRRLKIYKDHSKTKTKVCVYVAQLSRDANGSIDFRENPEEYFIAMRKGTKGSACGDDIKMCFDKSKFTKAAVLKIYRYLDPTWDGSEPAVVAASLVSLKMPTEESAGPAASSPASGSGSPESNDSHRFPDLARQPDDKPTFGKDIRRRLAPRGALRRLSILEQLLREIDGLQ